MTIMSYLHKIIDFHMIANKCNIDCSDFYRGIRADKNIISYFYPP